MEFDAILNSFGKLHTMFGGLLDTGLLMFCRILGFIMLAPIFNRKDLAFFVKLILAIFLTVAMVWVLPPEQHVSFTKDKTGEFLLLILINVSVGSLIGFMADLIHIAVHSAGDLMNNQVGLSSAVFSDPATRKQAALLESLFAFITVVVFMHIGGLHWLILAVKRSVEVFPLQVINQPILQTINLDYLVTLSGNTLLVATYLIAPVMVVTMAVDMILGIVNRTAQQMPVFQLSTALKPAIGIGVMLTTLPMFLKAVIDFLTDFSRVF